MSESRNFTSNGKKNTRALVIGGGIAGLFTARVLSDYYEEVLVIERDELPDKPSNRSGTPQAFHIHRILPRGNVILERFFSGYIDDLLAHGASPTQNQQIQFINQYGRTELAFPDKNASNNRALLEWVLRERLKQRVNISFRPNHDVKGLLVTSDKKQVIGISIQQKGQQENTTLLADLVIDASGRSSKLVKWLGDLGYNLPTAERLKVSLGYSSCYYQVSPEQTDKLFSAMIDDKFSEETCISMASPMENNILGTLLYNAGGKYYPPTDPAEYLAEFGRLSNPLIKEMLEDLEPLMNPRGYRLSECVRHHFEQMQDWPTGLLVLGDALCSLDPIHGQGMTVAAIEAEMLDTCLKEQIKQPQVNFERNTLQQMQNAIEPAWWLCTVADMRIDGVEYFGSHSLEGITFAQRYFDLFLKQAMQIKDSKVNLFQPYLMMNGLLISPYEVMNVSMLNMILDDSIEAKQLKEIIGENEQAWESVFERLIPSFQPITFEAPHK